MRRLSVLVATLASLSAAPARAQTAPDDATPESWALHAQSTYTAQYKPAFSAAYSGPNSLRTAHERAYSFTATGDFGLRLWDGGQLHFNPEAAQGVPLSRATGGGGLSNGELARTSGPDMAYYKARLFLLQRWSAGGTPQKIDADFNELGGTFTERRWTLVAGNVALPDYFDNNPYAKDPREQFLNWSFLTHGAWDFAADSRGYTIGALLEYRAASWSVRAGRFMLPSVPNGLALDWALRRHYGDQIEAESDLPLRLPAGPMRVRGLLFRNRAVMGRFDDALALGGVPDVSLVRRAQTKTGWGLTLEAPLGEDAGVFLRASRNDGHAEAYAFAEIDSQLSIGGQFNGAAWGRDADRVGAALALNGLSSTHRAYLAAGGSGFFLGDGALNYGHETVLETYYRYALPEWSTRAGRLQSALSLGVQHIANPGYNRDRGPVQVYSLRLHAEF